MNFKGIKGISINRYLSTTIDNFLPRLVFKWQLANTFIHLKIRTDWTLCDERMNIKFAHLQIPICGCVHCLRCQQRGMLNKREFYRLKKKSFWAWELKGRRLFQLEFGVVYSCLEDKMYKARKGKGAFCNDERIQVSDVEGNSLLSSLSKVHLLYI